MRELFGASAVAAHSVTVDFEIGAPAARTVPATLPLAKAGATPEGGAADAAAIVGWLDPTAVALFEDCCVHAAIMKAEAAMASAETARDPITYDLHLGDFARPSGQVT